MVRTIPPEVDESAAIDGAGLFTAFHRRAPPPLIALGTDAFFFVWNEDRDAVPFLPSENMDALPDGGDDPRDPGGRPPGAGRAGWASPEA